MIIATGLTKLYGEFVAVDHVNFEINEGEIFGILGPNGAGKTTIIRMLAAIFPPTEGTAKVANCDVVEDDMAVRSQVGILSENPSLYERLTARANLKFFARLYDVPTDQIDNRIEFLGEIFDLKSRLDDRVGTYSKGMKQKLAIAKALIHDPPVLFLDEPTSALSPEAAKVIRDLLVDLAKDRSRTICICTHNLHDAARLCDRVAVIRHGRILTVGTPGEISRAYSGPPTVRVKLGALDTALIEALAKVDGVISVDKDSITNNLMIKVDNHDEITPKIVRKIVEKNGEILEIEPIHASLEEAYLKLIEEDTMNGITVEENISLVTERT